MIPTPIEKSSRTLGRSVFFRVPGVDVLLVHCYFGACFSSSSFVFLLSSLLLLFFFFCFLFLLFAALAVAKDVGRWKVSRGSAGWPVSPKTLLCVLLKVFLLAFLKGLIFWVFGIIFLHFF